MPELIRRVGIVVLVLLVADSTSAYLGPGVGLGAIVVVTAVALGIVLLIAGFLWYPIKRALRSARGDRTMPEGSTGSTESTGESSSH